MTDDKNMCSCALPQGNLYRTAETDVTPEVRNTSGVIPFLHANEPQFPYRRCIYDAGLLGTCSTHFGPIQMRKLLLVVSRVSSVWLHTLH